MLKRSHVDERGFDKVDMDLATAVTLVLLLRIAGVQAAPELRFLWTCDAVALNSVHSNWWARSGWVTLGLVAYLGAVRDLVYTYCKRQFLAVVGELSPALAAAVWVHSERLRSWQAEDGRLVNLLPVGSADVGPDVWMLPPWFLLASDPLVPRDALPACRFLSICSNRRLSW